MNFAIREESSVPKHRQLVEQIKQMIWNGQLEPGSRLPSVRELAGFLRINRNTAASAYEELEREGFVISQGAKGTRVAERPPRPPRQPELSHFFTEVLQRAGELGLSPEDCAVQLLAFVQGNPLVKPIKQRALVLECNRPQLEQFRRELEKSLPLSVDTMLIEELQRGPLPDFNEYRVVITTFFHADEVKSLLIGSETELVTLLLQGNLPALLRLRQLIRGTRVALICETEDGLQNFLKSLHEAGLEERLQIVGGVLSDTASVEKALETAQVVISSSDVVESQVRPLLRQGIELITDDRSLDQHGIDLLRRRLLGGRIRPAIVG